MSIKTKQDELSRLVLFSQLPEKSKVPRNWSSINFLKARSYYTYINEVTNGGVLFEDEVTKAYHEMTSLAKNDDIIPPKSQKGERCILQEFMILEVNLFTLEETKDWYEKLNKSYPKNSGYRMILNRKRKEGFPVRGKTREAYEHVKYMLKQEQDSWKNGIWFFY